ncbi:MAG: hypothetical protein OXI46_06260 [Gemmatimonadota bacterium]|nr:hypothetical protein [Gemmatimonadota bacterium]
MNHVNDVDVIRADVLGMPERIVVSGTSQTVALAAGRMSLLFQVDAPTTILSAVPGVLDQATWLGMAIPETPGWTVHRFSSSRLRWVEAAGTDAIKTQTGLFRFVMRHQRFHYLRWRGRSYRIPVQVGKYVVMRRRRGLLAYDAATKTLSVPAVCRPPLLIERAIILCSGLLPVFDARSRRVEYTNVPPDVARLAAQLLRQEVR